MTIDAYEPEGTVEEMLTRLKDCADWESLLVRNRGVTDGERLVLGPWCLGERGILSAGDVRWLCDEVLRLRAALTRPRLLVAFNGGRLNNRVGEIQLADDQETISVPLENHQGQVTITDEYRLLRTYLSPEGKNGPYTVRLAEYWSTTC